MQVQVQVHCMLVLAVCKETGSHRKGRGWIMDRDRGRPMIRRKCEMQRVRHSGSECVVPAKVWLWPRTYMQY